MGLEDAISAVFCIHAAILALALRVCMEVPFSVGLVVMGLVWSAALLSGGLALRYYHTRNDDTMLIPILFSWTLCFSLVFWFGG